MTPEEKIIELIESYRNKSKPYSDIADFLQNEEFNKIATKYGMLLGDNDENTAPMTALLDLYKKDLIEETVFKDMFKSYLAILTSFEKLNKHYLAKLNIDDLTTVQKDAKKLLEDLGF